MEYQGTGTGTGTGTRTIFPSARGMRLRIRVYYYRLLVATWGLGDLATGGQEQLRNEKRATTHMII